MRIAVDAGHGSNTAGKRTPDGYREHWINVMVATCLVAALQRYGFDVLKVGFNDANAKDDADLPLASRKAQIKAAGCDLSVSVHANAHGSGWNSANGVETFVHATASKVKDSRTLATLVQAELVKGTPQTNRGVKTGNLAMCDAAGMGTKASILVELGFMTNKREANLMESEAFCREQAEDIARGIVAYTGLQTAGFPGVPFVVKVARSDLRIRTGAGTGYAYTDYIKPGSYTIIEVKAGSGSTKGWGRLKSGAGWIALDYAIFE